MTAGVATGPLEPFLSPIGDILQTTAVVGQTPIVGRNKPTRKPTALFIA
jgi:hypothetical protein